jgi:hypothetical protein
MDVKAAIEHGDASALRHLLARQPARTNEVILWGPDEKNRCCPLHDGVVHPHGATQD